MRNTPYTIAELQKIAKKNKGRCLSNEYKNAHTKLEWECKLKHVWSTNAANITQGKWCPTCGKESSRKAKIKYTILDMQKLAKKHSGICLSDKYFSYIEKLKWQCKNNHEFKSSAAKVIQGNWCPYCAGRGNTIDSLHKLAKSRGGKYLSPTYPGIKAKACWECKNGHKWLATIDNVLNRESWCPQCSSGKGETLVRIFFEELFQSKFPKKRPDWLRNKEGKKLELDGYNETLGIAFEHQGEFHYRKIRQFDVSTSDLKRRKEMDQIKRRLCKEKSVILIVVPEVGNLIQKDDLKNFLINELVANKVNLPANYKEFLPDYERHWIHEDNDKLTIVRTSIEAKNGKLKSTVFLGTSYKLKIECEFGHNWESLFHNILKGKWCPVCNGNPTISLTQMQELASTKGGSCLSNSYINNQTHLVWKCDKSHIWAARPTNIMRGTWCPKCKSGKEPNLKTLKEAKKKTIK